jgi:hypothetical protein
MKTTAIPAVRVEPELRSQLEEVLHEGETLSSFVEASVRDAVRRRIDQAEFVARGLASIRESVQNGTTVPADELMAQLRVRADEMRAELTAAAQARAAAVTPAPKTSTSRKRT